MTLPYDALNLVILNVFVYFHHIDSVKLSVIHYEYFVV